MAKRRPSGDGMVRKREDGRWEGRIVAGHKENGDSIFRYIYADTQKELTAKLRQHIDIYQGVDLTEQSRMTLGEWMDQWLENITGTTSSRTLYRSRRRFLFQSKRHLSLTPSLLLSNCDPLRWARSWFPSGQNEYAPDRFPVGHVFIVLEWFSISPLSPSAAVLCPGSARPWR